MRDLVRRVTVAAISALILTACREREASSPMSPASANVDQTASASRAAAGTLCGGLPRLNVVTPSGFCVGIVAQGLSTPRGVLPLSNGDVLVTELFGNLIQLQPATPTYGARRLLTGLDLPHGIVLGPDGKIYVGEDGAVFRLTQNNLTQREYVINNIPAIKGTMHYLTSLAFDPAGNLYATVGAPSDNCQQDAFKPLCSEANDYGLVRKYSFQWPAGTVTGWSVFARGLRNSVALAAHSSGTVIQGENSRDYIHLADPLIDDEEHPSDEINVLQAGVSYGWPYCYENGKNSPEFPMFACATTRNPAVLLPAHSAPLGMLYWNKAPNGYKKMLVVTLAGYRKYGHRVVAFPVSAKGVPNGPMVELIKGWDNPLGAPTDIKEGPDGSLFITDKSNNQVLVFRKDTGA